jgi:outer membrane protein
MKKGIVLSLLLAIGAFTAMNMQAQKFALIDMEYILKNIPAYEMANEQLNTLSKKWQTEVEAVQTEAQNLYKTYQADLVFLSPEMKTKKEDIVLL